MASGRKTKNPAKFDDCIVGDEFEDLFTDNKNEASSIESPIVHRQIDGKVNNVSFKTVPDRIEIWKRTVLQYFSPNKTTVLKEGAVIKIVCDLVSDKNCTIKINFYKSGSVVIQGANCEKFSELHFQKLKDLVPQIPTNSNFDENMNNKDLDTTVIENELFDKKDDNTLDSSITVEKQFVNVTSTPVKNHDVHGSTPKERLAQHSQTIASKLETVTSSLSSIETTLISFITKLAEIKSETDSILPNMKTYISDNSSSQKLNQFKEQMESIVKKMTHCNSTIDSLHIKMNLIDSQLKTQNEKLVEEITSKIANFEKLQTENKESLENLHEEISSLRHRLSSLEQDGSSVPAQIDLSIEQGQHNETQESLVQEESVNSRTLNKEKNKSNTIKECDYLLLTDSVLRRIMPRKFTPKGVTVKRFIRGGALTCEGFIENHGPNFLPQNVLIHIGTRDLQNKHGVKNDEYQNLYVKATETWPQAKIYVMPIIRRKDITIEEIDKANSVIAQECENFESITLLDKFSPTNDMFYDQVHLNNQKGLPAMVKHLKHGMKMYTKEQTMHNRQTRNPYPRQGGQYNGSQRNPPRPSQGNLTSNNFEMDRQSIVPPFDFPRFSSRPSQGNQTSNNFEMDRQSLVPPFEVPRFPWVPPPNNFPPWQNPWFWQLPPMNNIPSHM